jgi:hypothetical protein
MDHRLAEDYAIRARHFSEAVARLGSTDPMHPEFLNLLDEIERLQELCVDAGKRLRLSTPPRRHDFYRAPQPRH